MGFQGRGVRAAATALLVVAAVGSGGMGGLTSALAADPGTIELTGTLVAAVDGIDAAVPGVDLVIIESSATDGGFAAFQVTTAADGSFAADVFAWGSAEDPATVSIAPARPVLDVIDGNCSRRWAVAVEPSTVVLSGAPPEPVVLRRTLALSSEVCGTTATPPANGPGSGPRVTPPPTDLAAAPAAASAPQPDRLAPALLIGFVSGLLAAAGLRRSRPGARGRD